jgi:hypothetical protein
MLAPSLMVGVARADENHLAGLLMLAGTGAGTFTDRSGIRCGSLALRRRAT